MEMKETNSKSLDYTCIFGGGAVRGMAYVGAIKAMEDLQINCKTIAGSSVGAIFAGLLAVGYTAAELKDIFLQVNYELFKDIHFGFGKDFALSKGEIFLEWIRDLIEKKFYGYDYKKGTHEPVTFKDLHDNLIILTTDLKSFKCKEFSKFQTPDVEIAFAIKISSSMPGLMKPTEFEDMLLVDGDLQKSWPLWKLTPSLYNENDRILEFRLEGEYQGIGNNAINFANTVYSCVTSLATDYIIDTYNKNDKFDYIKLNTGSVVVVDFSIPKDKREALMEVGYNTTLEYFNNLLKEKKKIILKYYKNIYKYIKLINKHIEANKISKARFELGNLYMNISPAKEFIDVKDFNLIEHFKEKFLQNIFTAGLLGICLLKHHKSVDKEIKDLSQIIQNKISELEKYIKY